MKDILNDLDIINETLMGACGRLIVTAISNQEVKEAHKMILDASSKLDDVINEIMEKANA